MAIHVWDTQERNGRGGKIFFFFEFQLRRKYKDTYNTHTQSFFFFCILFYCTQFMPGTKRLVGMFCFNGSRSIDDNLKEEGIETIAFSCAHSHPCGLWNLKELFTFKPILSFFFLHTEEFSFDSQKQSHRRSIVLIHRGNQLYKKTLTQTQGDRRGETSACTSTITHARSLALATPRSYAAS